MSSTAGEQAPRSLERVTGSKIAAASPNRTAVSQTGGSHPRATLDSGTVVPHSVPAMTSAAIA